MEIRDAQLQLQKSLEETLVTGRSRNSKVDEKMQHLGKGLH